MHRSIALMFSAGLALSTTGTASALASDLGGVWELHVDQYQTNDGPKGPISGLVVLRQRDGRLSGHLGQNFGDNIEISGRRLTAETTAQWPNAKFSAAVREEIERRNLPVRFEGTLSEDARTIEGTVDQPWVRATRDRVVEMDVVPVAVRLQRVNVSLEFTQANEDGRGKVRDVDYGAPFTVDLKADRPLMAERLPVLLHFMSPEPRREIVLAPANADRTRYRSQPIVFTKPDGGDEDLAFTAGANSVVVTMPVNQLLRASGARNDPYAVGAVIAVGELFQILRIALLAVATAIAGGALVGGGLLAKKLVVRHGLNSGADLAQDTGPQDSPNAPQLRVEKAWDAGTQEIARGDREGTQVEIRIRRAWDSGRQSVAESVSAG